MIYKLGVVLTVTTEINKVVIESDEKRIVLMPVNRRSEDIYCIVNDRPGGQIVKAADVLRWLSQNLLTKAEFTKLVEKDIQAQEAVR